MQRGVIQFTLLITLPAIFALGTFAQSGRKKPVPNPVQTPIPVIKPSLPAEEAVTVPPKIASIIVVGEIFHDYQYFKSTMLDSALKEFVYAMKSQPRAFRSVDRAGKLTFDGAKERAKKETDVHLVWLGIVTHDNGLGRMYVDHLEFAVLVPGTAKILFNGRIEPGEQRIVGQSGVLKLPTITNGGSAGVQMMLSVRQVSDRLKSTGWLCSNAPC